MLLRGVGFMAISAWTLAGRRGLSQQHKVLVRELSRLEIDQTLERGQSTHSVDKDAVTTVEFNQLGSNDPCEDHASAAIALASSGDSVDQFYGVYDGHAGASCSKALAHRLVEYLGIAAMPLSIQAEIFERLKYHEYDAELHLVEFMFNTVGARFNPKHNIHHRRNLIKFLEKKLQVDQEHSKEADPSLNLRETMRERLREAFQTVDHDLTMEAVRSQRGPEEDPEYHAESVRIVTAGSCAVVAHVNGADLHVASVGDCRAVLGVHNLDSGEYQARVITKDHTVENLSEVDRLQSAHPVQEHSTMLKGGRLLSLLYPLRAFGDVRFKWTSELQRRILSPFLPAGVDPVPPGYHTPPYLTSLPEVYYHRLHPNDRFLILASDGLWEMLSPLRVVRLVSDHFFGRQTLSPYFRTPGATVAQILQELRLRRRSDVHGTASGNNLDSNGATHIMRHALGGFASHPAVQYKSLQFFLNLPKNQVRRFRDDITITVIHFNSDYLQEQTEV